MFSFWRVERKLCYGLLDDCSMKQIAFALSGGVLAFMIVGLCAPISAALDVTPVIGSTVKQDIFFQIKYVKVTTKMPNGQEVYSSIDSWDTEANCNYGGGAGEARLPPLHFHAYLTALVWF